MPSTLLIEGVPYTVQRASRADMGENWGRIDYIACTIYLRDDLSPGQLQATLLHELLHAAARGEDDIREEHVERIADRLYGILASNGLWRPWVESDA